MLNQIFLMGRLARDPEVRHTQSGVTVCSFTLAVDRDFKDRNTGERATDWIPVTAWRGTGERVSQYTRKGDLVVVVGRLEMQEWTDKQGNKRTTPNVNAESVYFTGGIRKESNGAPEQSYRQEPPQEQSYTQQEFMDLSGTDDSDFPF